MCEKIMDSAKGFEADMLITACPLCMYNLKKERKRRSSCLLFYRTSCRSSRSKRGGGEVMAYTYGNTQNAAERIKEISGVNPLKCMKCGKCSATCPAFNEMDIKPHQFCNLCTERRHWSSCTVKILMEMPLLLCMCRTAVQEMLNRENWSMQPDSWLVRERGQNYLTADEIPELLDEDTPQQLLVSAFRRYRRWEKSAENRCICMSLWY